MSEFELLYSLVKHIVHRARKDYYLKGWEKEDWDQEGMLVLYELLSAYPGLSSNRHQLYVYYKVKFRNYIKDRIRKQESQKRTFDRMVYEEVSELGHSISSPGLLTDDYLALKDLLERYKESLSPQERMQYGQLMSGQRFKGRSQMLSHLRNYLSDFQG